MHRPRHSKGVGCLFKHLLCHTIRVGRQIDSFFRSHGQKIRDMSAMVAPLLAGEFLAAVVASAVLGQAAAACSQLRDKLDEAG